MKKNYILLVGILCLSLNLVAQQELITNGSFDLGDQGWDISLATNGYADQGSCEADDGQNYLWFGDVDELTGINNMEEVVKQTVSLPSNLDFAEFSFRWSGTSDEQDDVNVYDMLYFWLLDENGDPIYVDSISNADLNPSLTVDLCDVWYGGVVFTIDSQYAGQVVDVIFAAYSDGDFPTIFRIDNVSILAATTSTGLSETIISLLEISPNPANEKIVINSDSSTDILVTILNSDGRTIQSVNLLSGKNELNISSLSNGLYFIQEPNGSVTKIIKQ
jgi:hemin uptake protein HemP